MRQIFFFGFILNSDRLFYAYKNILYIYTWVPWNEKATYNKYIFIKKSLFALSFKRQIWLKGIC